MFQTLIALSVGANVLASSTTTLNLNIDTDKNDVKTYFKSQYLTQDSDVNSVNRFQVQAGVELEKRMTSKLKFQLDAAISLETGSSDSLYANNEFEPKNDISLKKAEFSYEVLKDLNVTFGALAMQDLEMYSLVGHGTFLGAKEVYLYQDGLFSAELLALQSIPKNRNFSNRVDNIDEGNPSFYFESLKLKYGSENEYIYLKAAQFAYANLSNTVAGNSYYYGNTVTLTDSKNGEFLYSYIGNAYRFGTKFSIGKFSFNPFGEYVVNNSAPSENEGTLLGVETSYSSSDKVYSVETTMFDTEADASVAVYNSTILRHNNKIGNVVRFAFKDEKENLEISGTFVNAKHKEELQLDDNDTEQLVGIMLRKEYDLF